MGVKGVHSDGKGLFEVDEWKDEPNRRRMQSWNIDRPIKSPEDDRLHRLPFVKHLAKRLVRDRKSTGLIIGLIGPWGCGKTSVLNLLQIELEQNEKFNHPLIVRFNPWLVSNRDDLIGHFFLELTRNLRERVGRYDVYSDGSDQRKDNAIGVIADYGAAISPLMSVLAPRLGHGVNALRALAERKRERDGSIHLKRERVRNALLAFDFPIVVMIDELDRLEDNEVRTMAQLLRSVGDFDSISYVAAYDEERVVEALSSGPDGTRSDRGKAYLEKIVQIRVSTPRMTSDRIEAIFREDFFTILGLSGVKLESNQILRLGRIIQHAVPEILSTTRDLTKVLSYYAGRLIGLENDVDAIDLLGLTILANRAPELYDRLAIYHADRRWTVAFPNARTAHAYIQTQKLPRHNLPGWALSGPFSGANAILNELAPQAIGGHPTRSDLHPNRAIFSAPLSAALGQEQAPQRRKEGLRNNQQNTIHAKTSWLAQPRNFSKIYDLDEHPADIKQKNIATLYNKICDLSMPKNKSSASIGSLQLIQSCSLLMRLQDRNPELRSPLRDVIRNDFSTKPTYFGMAFFADSVFLSIIQQQVPGIFWQRPEAIQQVECLPKLAKLITSNSYKFNLAISLLTPPNITNAENGYVPEDYRKLICENSIFNANFADDLIDLFFNPIIPLTHV